MITFIGGLTLVFSSLYAFFLLLRENFFKKTFSHSSRFQILLIIIILIFVSGLFSVFSSIVDDLYVRELFVKVSVGSLRVTLIMFWIFIDVLDSDRFSVVRAFLPLAILAGSIVTYSTVHYHFFRFFGFWERSIAYGGALLMDYYIAFIMLIAASLLFLYKDLRLRRIKKGDGTVPGALVSIFDITALFGWMLAVGLVLQFLFLNFGIRLLYSVVMIVSSAWFEVSLVRIYSRSPLTLYAYGLYIYGYGVLRRSDFMPIYLHLKEERLEKCVYILFSGLKLDFGVSVINFFRRVFVISVGKNVVFVLILNRSKEILKRFAEFVVDLIESVLEFKDVNRLTPFDIDSFLGRYIGIFF